MSISKCKIQYKFRKMFFKLKKPSFSSIFLTHIDPRFDLVLQCGTKIILLIGLNCVKMWLSYICVGSRSWVLGVFNSFMFWL